MNKLGSWNETEMHEEESPDEQEDEKEDEEDESSNEDEDNNAETTNSSENEADTNEQRVNNSFYIYTITKVLLTHMLSTKFSFLNRQAFNQSCDQCLLLN